jgi:hypothetical protein
MRLEWRMAMLPEWCMPLLRAVPLLHVGLSCHARAPQQNLGSKKCNRSKITQQQQDMQAP